MGETLHLCMGETLHQPIGNNLFTCSWSPPPVENRATSPPRRATGTSPNPWRFPSGRRGRRKKRGGHRSQTANTEPAARPEEVLQQEGAERATPDSKRRRRGEAQEVYRGSKRQGHSKTRDHGARGEAPSLARGTVETPRPETFRQHLARKPL